MYFPSLQNKQKKKNKTNKQKYKLKKGESFRQSGQRQRKLHWDRWGQTGTGEDSTDRHPTLSKSMSYVAIMAVLNTLAWEGGLEVRDRMFETTRSGLMFQLFVRKVGT